MGPTNLALVRLFEADQKVREAEARLDAATKDVRIQERRVKDLTEKLSLAQARSKEASAKAGQLDLEVKSREAHIEKLREQQQTARNNKEYQTFLIEINTGKVDKAKLEEEWLRLQETIEKGKTEVSELTTHLDSEKSRLQQMREQITDKIQAIQGEIDALKPTRREAASAVPAKAREAFERMADRFDGEAMAALARPDRRREEYVCTSCNMELVTDVYNRLHTRDEVMFCPSCRRLLYIPEDLPPAEAIAQKGKPASPRKPSARKSAKSKSAGGNGAAAGEASIDPTLLRLLTNAAGESVRNAVAAGNDPVECQVQIDGKPFGTFKGQNAVNLERTIKYVFGEAGISLAVQVTSPGPSDVTGEAANAPDSPEAPTDPSSPQPVG